MRRYLALVLPAFRLERCGYAAEDVAAVVAEVRNAVRVVSCTPAAAARGISVGMSAAMARSAAPEIQVERLDAGGEAEDLASLVAALRNFTDRVRAVGTSEVLLEVGQLAAWSRREEDLVAQVRAQVEAFGHRVSLALSESGRASLALARAGVGPEAVPAGALAAALAPLPLSVFALASPLLAAMEQVGIRIISDFIRLNAASVSARYGQAGLELFHLAHGRAPEEVWEEASFEAPVAIEVRLPEPTELLASLLFTLQGCAAQVEETLMRREQRAARFSLYLALEGGEDERYALRLGRPTREAKAITEALRQLLSGVHLRAPVRALGLVVEETAPALGRQQGLIQRLDREELWPELYARLEGTLGAQAVFRARERDRWRPEEAWSAVPYDERRYDLLCSEGKADPVEEMRFRRYPRPRPAILLEIPRPLEVRGEIPQQVEWDRRWIPVTQALGPERLSGGWWTEAPFARDYWEIALQGRWAWVFRENERWFLHGWFD